MKTLISIGSVAIGSIALNLLPVPQLQAASLVQNGDFTQNNVTNSRLLGGSMNNVAAGTATGWTFGSGGLNWLVKMGTTYTQNLALDQNNTDLTQKMYGSAAITNPIADSPDFGTNNGFYIVSDGDTNYTRNISQTIDNLLQGEQYEVSFYQAAGQQTNFYGGTTEQWDVTFGNNTKTSALMSPVQPYGPGEDTFDGQGQQVTGGTATAVSSWQKETMIFTAGSTSQTLNFLAKGKPDGKPPFALLTGVSVKQIPEPADYVGTLVSVGFVSLAIKSRLAKKKLDE
jgi:hypothetical protein